MTAKKKKNLQQEIDDPKNVIGQAEGLSRSMKGIPANITDRWDYRFDDRGKDPFDENQCYYASMYHKALKCEQLRVIWTSNQSMADQPKEFLDRLATEIKCRIKITQSEIFKIGEILVLAKKVCQQNNLGFKDWIRDTFDFSYETANNFMNVYTHCMGNRHVALKMKPSLLYKVSSPSFPDELREWLFEKGNLSKITNGKLKGLQQKFKKGGWEAIQEDVQELSDMGISEGEISNYLDQYDDIIRRIKILSEKMEHDGNNDISYKIIQDLRQGLETSWSDLRNKRDEAIEHFQAELQITVDKANDVTPLEMAS